ncbi:MAG: acyl-ACP--UDP-N-acetylglucosamine O-acyltransferase [Desulfobacterales bacterium]|jgi:UDP-N-acetylglucosamine acyltransferase
MIHATAIVSPQAEIDVNVDIGPFAIVAADAAIGAGTTIGSHSVIDSHTTIGPECRIFPHAVVGGAPQSLKYAGQKTYAKIGRGTIIREFTTVHRGTAEGGGVTEVGNHCLLMAYSHVAHDCRVGSGVVLANAATLAGHILIGDFATIGGLVAIHQFVRIGEYAFVGGKSAVVKDVPPYVIAAGDRATLHGLNRVGLRRHGFSETSLSLLKKAYRIIFRIGLTLNEALERVRAEVDQVPEVVNFIKFIESSHRGITR